MKIIIGIVLALCVAYVGYLYFSPTAEAPTVASQNNVQKESITNQVQYACAEDKVLVAWFSDQTAKIALTEDKIFTLTQVSDDDSGTAFENKMDQMVFWVKDQSAFLEQNGTTTYSACRAL